MDILEDLSQRNPDVKFAYSDDRKAVGVMLSGINHFVTVSFLLDCGEWAGIHNADWVSSSRWKYTESETVS